MGAVIVKSVSVSSFGCLRDFSASFSDGIASIEKPNGWGKSTLAAFIKAMFYGLEDNGKKKDVFYERERYKPWSGGVFGGSLTFKTDEKIYRVERAFADKRKNDSFKLFDCKTNTESGDYGCDLGAELFGVNVDTFERSVFITLDPGKAPQKSDDITAKLGDLVQNDDAQNFSKAMEALEKAAGALKGKSGRAGEIPELEKKIKDDEAALREIADCEKRLAKIESDMALSKSRKDEKVAEQNALQKALAGAVDYEKRLQREALLAEIKSAEGARLALLDFFGGEDPGDFAIDKIDKAAGECAAQSAVARSRALRPSEKAEYDALLASFKGDVPSADDVSRVLALSNRRDALRREESGRKMTSAEADEYSSLLPKWRGVTSEEIDKNMALMDEAQKLGETLLAAQNEKAAADAALSAKKAQRPRATARIAFLFAAVVLAAAGVVCLLARSAAPAQSLAASIASMSAAALCAIAAALKKPAPIDASQEEKRAEEARKTLDSAKSRKTSCENSCDAFIARLSPGSPSRAAALAGIKARHERFKILSQKDSAFREWLGSLPEKIDEIEKEILSFVSRYGATDADGATMLLGNMKASLAKLENYGARIDSGAESERKSAEAKEALVSLMGGFKTQKTAPLESQAKECRENKKALQLAGEREGAARKKLSDFDRGHSAELTQILEAREGSKTPARLESEIESARRAALECESEIARAAEQESKLIERIDEKREIENDMAISEESAKEKSARRELILKAAEFLSAAQEELRREYMDPMAKGFAKYSRMMDDSLGLDITGDLSVTFSAEGATRESKSLSEGCKDMANVCARLALVDALFTKEKPPVMLDDPFVNLDDDKVEKALQMTRELSRDRQVIYFACHKSRSLALL